jgi:hypothetical protein
MLPEIDENFFSVQSFSNRQLTDYGEEPIQRS